MGTPWQCSPFLLPPLPSLQVCNVICRFAKASTKCKVPCWRRGAGGWALHGEEVLQRLAGSSCGTGRARFLWALA